MATKIRPVGADYFDRNLYVDEKGNYYCDVELDRAMKTGDTSSICIKCPREDSEGEPDYHVDVEICESFDEKGEEK